MKKRMTVLFSMFLVLILTGCGQDGGTIESEVTPVVSVAPEITEEPEITQSAEATVVSPTQSVQAEVPPSGSEQALAEFQKEIQAEGSLCAAAYLGCQSGEFTEFYEWLEAAEVLAEYPFLEELAEERSVLAAGEEWYAIVPADNSMTLTVNETAFDETDYSLKAGKELLQVSDGSPVLLRGNISDIMPNLMVTVVKNTGESLVYCPALSLRDGYLQKAEGVYDFTQYENFMDAERGMVHTMRVFRAENRMERWEEDCLLSSGSCVTLRLGEEDAARYPVLADVLAKKAEEELQVMADQVEKLEQWAREDGREGYCDECDIIVERADGNILSIRKTYYEYSGGVHPNNCTRGLNLNPASGEEYTLNDIMTDTTDLLGRIEEKLFETYPAEIFYAEQGKVLEEYTTEQLVWILGYQGITFYFSPYDIAPYVAGTLTATIWFDEAPALFYEEYTCAPEQGYTVSFFPWEEIWFDQNISDDRRDSLYVYRMTAETEGQETITICYNEKTYQETVYTVQNMTPYLVCSGMPGGENYTLYLALFKDGETVFYVYDLNGEEITRTEVLQDLALEGFYALEAGEEVFYEELLPAFGY